MADIQLKVSPEELKKKAGEIEQQIAELQREWMNLRDIAKTSRYYWEGEAGDEGRRFMEAALQNMQDVLDRFRQQPQNLLQMAGIYIDAETKAAMLANALPDNVLS